MSRLIQKTANLILSVSLALGFTISATALTWSQPAAAEASCLEGFNLTNDNCVAIYSYSQGASQLLIPKGIGAIQIELFGGSGGSGGTDCGVGCTAAPGGDVGHLQLNFSDLSGQTIGIYPGDSGKNGATGASGNGGGAPGKSSYGNSFDGGKGGNAGPTGSSGGGAGGGAASVVRVLNTNFVAAGAGGGGGSANSPNGSTAGNTADAYVLSGSVGGEGRSSSCNFFCDGGGGGGGGGGVIGGAGGGLYQAPNGDREAAGFGGSAGTNTPIGSNVKVSDYASVAGAGVIIIKYTPDKPPSSIELITESPTNASAYLFHVAMPLGASFTAQDIKLSGSAAEQTNFVAGITKRKISGDSTIFTVSVKEPEKTVVTGDLIITIFGVSSEPITILQTKPTASISLQPATARSLIHVYDVVADTELTNVSKSSFSSAGTAIGCQVSDVSGSGTRFQVSLANCGSGTFGLVLNQNGLTDSLGNQGPESSVSSDLSDMNAPVLSIQKTEGTIPEEFLKAPVQTIFGPLSNEAQTLLESQGVYAPMDQAPLVNLITDLSASTPQDQIAYQKVQQVDVGSSVDLSVTVSPSIAAASDLVAFIQAGNAWQFAGRTSFENNTASANAFGIAKQGKVNVRLVLIPKTVVITNMVFKPGFGKGLGIISSVTNSQTQLSNQIVDITIDAVPGASGVPSVVETLTPTAPQNPLGDLLALTLPTLNPGAPIANPGIGATGDDNSPSVPFNPIGSPAAIAATVKTTATTVAVVSTVAAAAGAAAGAASSAGSSSASSSSRTAGNTNLASSSSGGNNSSSQDTNQQDGSIANIDAEVESFTSTRQGRGDKLRIFRWRPLTFLDKPTHDLTIRISKFSPVISKIINDGAYLRAMLGSAWLGFPIAGIALATYALMTPVLQISAPDWRIFIAIAVLGMFDAFSGLLATLIFAIGMMNTFGINEVSDLRLMLGVLVVGFGPALVAVAFRQIRKHFETNFGYFWERFTDVAVLVFFTGWTVSSMVGTLPALAGRTLSAANHVADFGFFLSIAIVVRILLEEMAARVYPSRLDRINPTEVISTSQLQKVLSTALRLGVFVFVTAAFMGNTWQVWVGSVIFILPNVLSWFEDRLPNSPLIWKLIPQGLPGLAFSLLVASYTSLLLSSWLGHRTDFSQWSFMLMPIPMFLVGLVGMFGREGRDDEDRPIKSSRWRHIYRVGGVVMLALTMKIAGVI